MPGVKWHEPEYGQEGKRRIASQVTAICEMTVTCGFSPPSQGGGGGGQLIGDDGLGGFGLLHPGLDFGEVGRAAHQLALPVGLRVLISQAVSEGLYQRFWRWTRFFTDTVYETPVQDAACDGGAI